MKPRFYCEHCKKEVSARDKVCPHCGRFFSEVRCPKCGFTGEGKLFYDGCPSCGYLSSSYRGAALSGSGGLEFVNLSEIEGKDSNPFNLERGRPSRGPSPWTFLIITISLSLILGMLLYVFLSIQ